MLMRQTCRPGLDRPLRFSVIACGTAALISAIGVSAAPIPLSNIQDPGQSSAFSLDFGSFGGIASATITDTDFALEIDPAAGSARFTHYLQHVEPLILPDGSPTGVSTGSITVEIIESLGGAFNRATGEFETNDVYAVHFTGDLSAFGITSPFILPSTSTGKVTFDTVANGNTDMEWIGQGLLAQLPFTYTCSVHGTFSQLNSTGFLATSFPESGAVDARQPHPINDPAMAQGWTSIEVRFNGTPLAAITDDDFSIDGLTVDGSAVEIVDVTPVDDRTFTLSFNEPLRPGQWATVSHPSSGTGLCLGFLPGDVNGDGVGNAYDVTALIDSLNQVSGRIRPDFATDINRSGIVNAMDVSSLIDLFNGAGEHRTWLSARLGVSPCE